MITTKTYDFSDFRFRASSFGDLMTCLPVIREFTEADEARLQVLEIIKETGINPETKRKNKYEVVQKEHEQLLQLKSGKVVDVLPSGAITKLNEIYNKYFWGRFRDIDSKQTRKGNAQENHGIELISYNRGVKFEKNTKRYFNDYFQGEMDIVADEVIDNKCSYDLGSFRKQCENEELRVNTYAWQTRIYDILLRDNGIKLKGYGKQSICYTLVNNPIEEIIAEKDRLKWKYNIIDEDEAPEEYWIERMQIEKNMIFDIEKFKEEHPFYDLDNVVLDFHIPKELRVKTFEVELTEEMEVHLVRRAKMCLKWLQNKAKEDIERLEQLKLNI